MNKILLVSLTVLVFIAVESSCATITEFFNNLPADISTAFTSAWHNIKDAIKRPVGIKRLGRGGRRKLKSRRSTSITTTTEATTISSTYLMLKKLELPILPTPKWKSLDEWKNLQKPRFALKSDGVSSRVSFGVYEK